MSRVSGVSGPAVPITAAIAAAPSASYGAGKGCKSEQRITGWRVKLYQLETEGAWLDTGTGSVSCRNVEGGPKIVVGSEDGITVILESKIRSDDIYVGQTESISMWEGLGAGFASEWD